MQEEIALLERELNEFQGRSPVELEAFRMKFISRKGALADLFEELKKAAPGERKNLGQSLNRLKQGAEAKFRELNQALENSDHSGKGDIDLTLPPVSNKIGNLHPLSLTRYR